MTAMLVEGYENIWMTQKQADAAAMYEDALSGDKRSTAKFWEAFSTSDMPTLLNPQINRRVQDSYEEAGSDWRQIAGTEIVDDFRLQELVKLRFGDDSQILEKNEGKAFVTGGLPRVGELGEYQTLRLSATGVNYRINKSGVKFALSWEEMVNNRSISLLDRVFTEFGKRAAKQSGFEAYTQYLTASGFSANLTDGTGGTNDNTLAGNPVLSRASLLAAMAQAYTHKIDGAPAWLDGSFDLVIPPTLKVTAEDILNVVRITDPTTGEERTNTLSGSVDIKVVPELLQINSGASNYWFIQSKGLGEESGASVAFLRGHEAPRMFVKSTTVQTPEDGDFDHDAYETKVRHTASGLFKGTAGIVASTGAGS